MPAPRTYRRYFLQFLVAAFRERSRTALHEINTEFLTDEESNALTWVRGFVAGYNKFPNPRTMERELRLQLVASAPEPWSFYVDLLRRAHIFERGKSQYNRLIEAYREADVDQVALHAREFVALHQRYSERNAGVVDLADAARSVMDDYRIAQSTPGLRGIPTGWGHLDERTGGWQRGDLISIVGRPGVGKTYLLLHCAYAAYQAGFNVLFVSNEMGVLQIARRFIGIHTGINPDYIRRGMLSTHVAGRLSTAITNLEDRPGRLRFVAGNMKQSVSVIRAFAEEYRPDIIFVDASYLLIPERKRQGSEGRRETFSDVVEDLRRLLLMIDRPLVQTVQFNRQAVRRPPTLQEVREQSLDPLSHLGLHHIAETDVVGQASAVVIGAEKPPPPDDNSYRYMGILKGREGETGHWLINYRFNPVDFSYVADPGAAGRNEAIDPEWML